MLLYHTTARLQEVFHGGFRDIEWTHLPEKRAGVLFSDRPLSCNQGIPDPSVLVVDSGPRDLSKWEWFEANHPFREWLVPAQVANLWPRVVFDETDRTVIETDEIPGKPPRTTRLCFPCNDSDFPMGYPPQRKMISRQPGRLGSGQLALTVQLECGHEITYPEPAVVRTRNARQSDPTDKSAAAADAAASFKLQPGQSFRVIELAQQLASIPWGSAVSSNDADRQNAIAFMRKIEFAPGDLARTIVSVEGSGRASRWDAIDLALLFKAMGGSRTHLSHTALQTLIDTTVRICAKGLMENFNRLHGVWARRFWHIPGRMGLPTRMKPTAGMTYTLVDGMTVRSLLRDELVADDPNPFEPMMEIFRQGLLIDWSNWNFTNVRGDDLGRLPEPPR